MKSTWTLPEGYAEKYVIDLKDNKKQFLLVNGLSLLIALVLVVPAVALWARGGATIELAGIRGKMLAFLVGMIVYIPLHELVHGICIRRFSGRRAAYGLALTYAYAGSQCYFDRRDYLVIAAAPVVFWGLIFAILCFVLPAAWRWVAYAWEVVNLSGAAGDIYVFWRLGKERDTILVQDTGVRMAVFDRT